ncbi:putative kinesin-like motor protein [Monocercomonoides exilis]|uniref:putative kinesin-like motor protein n=1 Tax=Monocercomonoides exilis TaxID=2049356 RepID=UPI00355A99DD|nr:putative kinesin-like motor protein [Monocercomonoides exilis]|eukprot:MONOS_9289.1-p1 / transcript=MONOS_9289.1 / gene=MONOS_9289 / organism=Monocercomonoides_exilis_PA203 / gene_product=kinesin-like motor protein / transcript_product=kinesin-like motor protein / location=Mono_scaffold00377:30440-32926(-) / protein_length=829 / sequence_SO=supercontig / SO=protein_coding / is_pseudo=false
MSRIPLPKFGVRQVSKILVSNSPENSRNHILSSNSSVQTPSKEKTTRVTTIVSSPQQKSPSSRSIERQSPAAKRKNETQIQNIVIKSKRVITYQTTSAHKILPLESPKAAQSVAARVSIPKPKPAGKRPSWDIKGKLEDLEEKFDSLMKKLNDSSSREIELTQQIAALQSKSGIAEKDLETWKEEIEKVENEKTKVELQLQEAKRQKEVIEDQIESVQSKLESTKKDCSFLQDNLESRNRTIMTLEQQQVEIRLQVSTFQAKSQLLHNEINEMRKILAEHDCKLLRMREKAHDDEKIRRDLHNKLLLLKGTMRAFCRVRPMTKTEEEEACFARQQKSTTLLQSDGTAALAETSKDKECGVAVVSNGDDQRIEIKKLSKDESGKKGEKLLKYTFQFDRVFNHSSTNDSVYEEVTSLVQSAVDGFTSCVFCSGPNGAGKHYTMIGECTTSEQLPQSSATPSTFTGLPTESFATQQGSNALRDSCSSFGIIPRAVKQLFGMIKEMRARGWNYSFSAVCLRVYCEHVYDVLKESKSEQASQPSSSSSFGVEAQFTQASQTTTSTMDEEACKQQETSAIVSGLDQLVKVEFDNDADVDKYISVIFNLRKTYSKEVYETSHFVCILFLNGLNTITGQATKGSLWLGTFASPNATTSSSLPSSSPSSSSLVQESSQISGSSFGSQSPSFSSYSLIPTSSQSSSCTPSLSQSLSFSSQQSASSSVPFTSALSNSDPISHQCNCAASASALSSLATFKDVINARITNSSNIPYNKSVLTSVLQPCLNGEAKGLMIVCIPSSPFDANPSLNALRLANLFSQMVAKTSSTKKKMECSID